MAYGRLARFWAAALLLPVAPFLLLAAELSPPPFQVNSRLVLVPLTVVDNYGKTVLGLQAKDFRVSDEGKPQPIVSFSSQDVPSSVGLVLDSSGSMARALPAAKEAAQAFVAAANPTDEYLLLTVSTQPKAGRAFTTDATEMEQDIRSAKPDGMTALIDTLYLGLKSMRLAAQPRRALIVFSDGMDNHSQYSANELLRAALEANVQVYTIAMDGIAGGSSGTVPFRPSMIAKPGDAAAQRQGPDLLEKLAEKTGGLHFHAGNAAEARQAILKAGEALRNQYVIGFQPAESGPAGKSHKIHVTTTVPKVYVHARSGYYAQ